MQHEYINEQIDNTRSRYSPIGSTMKKAAHIKRACNTIRPGYLDTSGSRSWMSIDQYEGGVGAWPIRTSVSFNWRRGTPWCPCPCPPPSLASRCSAAGEACTAEIAISVAAATRSNDCECFAAIVHNQPVRGREGKRITQKPIEKIYNVSS